MNRQVSVRCTVIASTMIVLTLVAGCEGIAPAATPPSATPASKAMAPTATPPMATPTSEATATVTPLPTLTGSGGGMIAFYSERDGNSEIYVMTVPDGTDADGAEQGSGDLRRLTNNPARDALPDWSPDGKQIAFQSERDGNWEIYVMNADGSDQRRLTHNDAADEFPNWSPDGTRIAFNSDRDGNAEIYVVDVVSGYLRRLTDNSSGEWQPAWSPDGTQIAFCSDRDGNVEIYVANVDDAEQGLGNQRRLTNNSGLDLHPAWSPAPPAGGTGSTRIAFFSRRDDSRDLDIYVMHVDGAEQGSGDLQRLTEAYGHDEFPTWSPDGSLIAFESERSGNEEIYVMNADGSDQRCLTNNPAQDYGPDWRP